MAPISRSGARRCRARRSSCCWRRHPIRCWRWSICARSRDLAHAAGAIVVVDNVFATPLLQQPLKFGADVVVYSCTKHIDGQGRVLGGAVLGKPEVDQRDAAAVHPQHRPGDVAVQRLGAAEGAGDAGAARRCRAAAAPSAIAEFLAARPEVTRVWYPTRADHPQQTLALKQMTAGGTVVTFEVAGGKEAAFSVMNAFGLIAVSNNLGDSKSLATHPATTTHMRIGPEERAKLGITDGVIRLSVGLEDVEDLKDDLAQALATIAAAPPRGRRSERGYFTVPSPSSGVTWPLNTFPMSWRESQ